MTEATARLDLRMTARDKKRIVRAAALRGQPVSAFVREVVLREAEQVITSPSDEGALSLSKRLRGRAGKGMSTDEIMRLTRGE